MQLTFGQKLLTAFGILLLLVMGAFTLSGDLRLQNTTKTYVDALIDDTVQQSTSSIAEWLNTRLVMTEATAKALESAKNDEEARVVLQAITTGGGFRDVYVGRTDGYMLMKSPEANATLPSDYDPPRTSLVQEGHEPWKRLIYRTVPGCQHQRHDYLHACACEAR